MRICYKAGIDPALPKEHRLLATPGTIFTQLSSRYTPDNGLSTLTELFADILIPQLWIIPDKVRHQAEADIIDQYLESHSTPRQRMQSSGSRNVRVSLIPAFGMLDCSTTQIPVSV